MTVSLSERLAHWASIAAAAALSIASVTIVVPAALAEQTCGGQPCTWNFDQIKVPSAQPLGNRGVGVKVAIVDSWVDHTHPALRDRVIGHALCVGTGGRCQSNTQSPDECFHGTHVAGTVASANYGVAPGASLLAVQVLSYDGDTCSGSADEVAAGIRYATSQRVDVINLSLGALVPGIFQSPAVTNAVREAARSGAVVVFAAGNRTVPVSDDYGSDVVLVAATGPGGGLASYSSRGGAIDLAAPGGDNGAGGLASCDKSNCILSTEPKGAYGLHAGTSMAAPHVAGTAALLLSQDPKRGHADVVATLRKTARPLTGTRHGLIDAEAALLLRAQPDAPTTTTRQPNGATTKPAQTSNGESTRPPTRTYGDVRSSPAMPGPGPYATDLEGEQPDELDLGLPAVDGDAPGGQAPSLAPQQATKDTPDRFPLPIAVASVALVGIAAWFAMAASAGRSRGRDPDLE